MATSHSDTPRKRASLAGSWGLAILLAACAGGRRETTGPRSSPGLSDAQNANPSTPEVAQARAGSSAPLAAGAAGSPAPSNRLGVHVEDASKLRVEVLVLSCNQDCADVQAVVSGGHPPYAIRWEDGSTSATRHVCSKDARALTVTVMDAGANAGPEFTEAPQTASAPVSVSVTPCTDGDTPGKFTDRHIFVTNRMHNNILELDEQMNVVRTRYADQGLKDPQGMAFTPEGAIWVADTGNNRIVAFDAFGKPVRTIDTAKRMGAGVESIYIDGQGTLYASATPGNGVIPRYSTATGADLPDVVNDPSLIFLGNINLTNTLHVVVTSYGGGAFGASSGLREMDKDTGATLHTFGTDLLFSEDVMIDGADRIFVAHYDGGEIVVFDAQRKELMRFTTPASEPNKLGSPSGIALTHDCRILVAGWQTNRIYEWHHRGAQPPEYVRSYAIDGLMTPESIAVAGMALPGGPAGFRDAVPSCD